VYLLDTDTVSNLLNLRRHHPRLRAPFLAAPTDQVSISIVSVEEMLRGALDARRRSHGRHRPIPDAYSVFAGLFEFDREPSFPLPAKSRPHRTQGSADSTSNPRTVVRQP
jgi:hypothetical protein